MSKGHPIPYPKKFKNEDLNVESPLPFKDDYYTKCPSTYKLSCLYMLGNTVFNPLNGTQYYWIKIGQTTNLYSRMHAYDSTNPMYYFIGIKEVRNEYLGEVELAYHSLLNRLALNLSDRNQEWFLVSKKDYMALCNKGFEFFD